MSTTWSSTGTRSVKAVCTTGTEANALGPTDGMLLDAVGGFGVHVEAAGAMTAGGTLQAYLLNPVTGQWNRCPDLDLSVQALSAQGFTGFSVPSGRGRVAYLPSGVGVGSSIYINATWRVDGSAV